MARDDQEVQIIVEAVDHASKELRGIGKAVGGLDGPIAALSRSMRPLNEHVATLGKTLAIGAAGGIAALGAGLAGVVATGLNFNNSMEQASAKINAFTKDSVETAKILEMVRDRAAKTPFAFEEMANAAAALGPAARQAQVPLESLIAQAEILAASNPAEGLEGAVFSLREALSGDFTSIIERFNLPKQRLKELAAEGVPALEAVQTAMKELGFDADLVSNMANTASGRWSTLMDTFTTLAATLTKPIFERVSAGMGELQTMIDRNMPAIQAYAETFAKSLAPAIETTIDAVKTFVQALAGNWQDQADKIAPIHRVFGEIGLIVKEVIGLLGEIWRALSSGDQPVTSTNDVLTDLADTLKRFRDLIREAKERVDDFNQALAPVAHVLDVIMQAAEDAGAAIRPFMLSLGLWQSQKLKELVELLNRLADIWRRITQLPGLPSSGFGGREGRAASGVATVPVSTVAGVSTRAFGAAPSGVTRTNAGMAAAVLTINVDARGAESPLAVEEAVTRGVMRALNEAKQRGGGRQSADNLRRALDSLARAG